MSQITEEMNEMKEIVKNELRTYIWKYSLDEFYQGMTEKLSEYFSSLKTEWGVVESIEEKNKIELLWDELKLFLEDDEDFQILRINNDSIKIKALNPMAFRKEYVYFRILSNIIPINCNLDLKSYYVQADTPEKDFMVFNLSIIAENKLYYKGRITINK